MPLIEYEGDKNRVLSGNARGETMDEVLARRFSRRAAMSGSIAAAAAVTLGISVKAQTPATSPAATAVADEPTLAFEGLSLQTGEEVVVPAGYTAVPFLRWGDPITPDAPEFDLDNLTAAAQEQQIGYNCDYIGWISLPPRLRRRGQWPPDHQSRIHQPGIDVQGVSHSKP